MDNQPPPIHKPSQPNWWDRNWKWFVPAGCLAALAVFALLATAIVLLVAGLMKSSDAFKEGFATANAHPAVREALGTPIKEGLFISGNINVSGPSGHVDIAIPISGPRGKAKIYLVGTKSAGQWTYSTLVVEIAETGRRIDLLR